MIFKTKMRKLQLSARSEEKSARFTPWRIILLLACSVFTWNGVDAQSPSELDTIASPKWKEKLEYVFYDFDRICPIIAYRGNTPLVELGVAMFGYDRSHYRGLELTALNNLAERRDNLTGLSLNYFDGWAIFEFGLTASYYTNWDLSRVYLKPYISAGLWGVVNISYGHNFSLGKDHFSELLNSDEFRVSLRYIFGL